MLVCIVWRNDRLWGCGAGQKYLGIKIKESSNPNGIGGTDYLRDGYMPCTVFNMGVNGLFATYFVLI